MVWVIHKTGEPSQYSEWDANLEKAISEGATRATIAQAKEAKKAYAIARLLKITQLKPGATVYCVLQNRARSGMSRVIQFLIPCIETDPKSGYNGKPFIYDASWLMADILGYTRDQNRGGLKVSGCGMDMGFHVVYSLGSAIWPNGTPEPHGTRNREPDFDGGYALKSHWL